MGLKGWLSARDVLWHCVFWGFAVNYMVRINLNIAIVSMVRRRDNKVSVEESECFAPPNSSNRTTLLGDHSQDGFIWDEYQQSLILGAFFWLHWLSQVPGGILAQKFGTKIVFGFSNLGMSLLSFLVPAASNWDYRALIVLRIMQGFIGGVCWPSMHNMAASWIPPNERSKFVTAYLGSSVGAGLTFPICGLLIDWFDWPAVFTATGVIGCTWFTAWWLLVYDTPAQHPRINKEELEFIQDSLGQSVVEHKQPVPWVSILTSKVMWMTTVTQCGGLWGLFTLLTQAPTYLKQIHGWDIRMTGFLSGMPHFLRIVFAYVLSHFADRVLKRKTFSRSTVRKFATLICTVGQGMFIFGLAFCGCNWMAAIVCVTMATMLSGAVSTGPLATFVDLSPNYASILLGISQVVGVLPGFLSPALVGALTYHNCWSKQNQTVGQWQTVFLISTAIVVIPGMFYTFFASIGLQSWNSPEEKGRELTAFQSEDKKELNPIVKDHSQLDKLITNDDHN